MGNEVEQCPHEKVELYVTAGRFAPPAAYWSCAKCGASFTPNSTTRASTPSPLTAEEAKERAREIVREWRARWKHQAYSDVNDSNAESDIVDRISELMTVTPSPSVGEPETTGEK